MADFLGWRLVRTAAETTAERLAIKQRIEQQNGPDTSELIWAADENSPELGLRIVRPRTREDYYYEGTLQNNCISGDQIDAFSRYPIVYSVRDENNLPLVSYEARYVPLKDWQEDPGGRERFFGGRIENSDYHTWKNAEDHGPGVLMTRQVCSVGNHVPGEQKLRAFIKANIGLMRQRGLDYMQYITAEGEHQPGVCMEGCPSNERESLIRNPLLSLADLEAIVDDGRKIKAGTKIYIAAPVYSANKDGEIEADAHRGALRILPVGKAFEKIDKTAQAAADDKEVEVEGQTVRIPRDYMLMATDYNERQLVQGLNVHDMLLGREGNGGGLSIAPNARFKVRDVVYKPQPKFLAVTNGRVSPGLETLSSYSGSHCSQCIPEEYRHLQVDSGNFVYEDEMDQYKDHVLIPLEEGDMHKFRRSSGGLIQYNELEHSLIPFDRLYLPDENNHFSEIKNGVRQGHAVMPENPMLDDDGQVIAKSAYGVLASSNFAPENGQFGNRNSVMFADSPDTVNHYASRLGWTPTNWLIKAGTDAFHHARVVQHEPVGDIDDEDRPLPEEAICGKRLEDGTVEGSCGKPHYLFSPEASIFRCASHDNACTPQGSNKSSGIRLRDLIYVGPEHEYIGSEDGTAPCTACGSPQVIRGGEHAEYTEGEQGHPYRGSVDGLAKCDDCGKPAMLDVHGKPLYMEEPHMLWDSETKKWKPNVDEAGNAIGGTKRIVRTGQDMGAADFHLVPDADEHLESITAPEIDSDDEDGNALVGLPSNISFYHANLNPARFREARRDDSLDSMDIGAGLPLSAYQSDRKVLPGPLFEYEFPLTPQSNPDLFSAGEDGRIFINPEAVDIDFTAAPTTEISDARRASYRLKKATSNPLRSPRIYFRARPLNESLAGDNSLFSDDSTIATSQLELSTKPLPVRPLSPSGELAVNKLQEPEFVCRRCGDPALLDESENPHEDKKTYKVYCDRCSKKWYQCPGGKSHRSPLRDGNRTAPDDAVEYLGTDENGNVLIHCKTCRDACGTCKSSGWVIDSPKVDESQESLFDASTYDGEVDRREHMRRGTRPENSRDCGACEGTGYLRRQRQLGSIGHEPVSGQKRGTVGLLTAENIIVHKDAVEIQGTHRTFDKNGAPEVRDLKITPRLLVGGGQIDSLGKGKAEWLRRWLGPMWRSASIVIAANDDKRLQTLKELTTQVHSPCGGSGTVCDGQPHENIKERNLWTAPDDSYSLKHLLNSHAFWVEGDLQTHCLGWNYQTRMPDGTMIGRDPNAVSLRDENNLPIITGDLRVVSLSDFRNNGNRLDLTIKDVPYQGWAQEDWRDEDPERPVPLPNSRVSLIKPLFSNDTWSKEIIENGERKPHPEEGVLLSRQLVTQRDAIPQNEQWIPFLKAIHNIMKDHDIQHFAYSPYSLGGQYLLSRDRIQEIVMNADIGDRLKGKKVYVQVPVANYDPASPDVIIPDGKSKVLPIGEAFKDVA